ncbi:hypothetical protein SELMODRAFT_414700 [Selaginella moellendorffii]|uniref:RRM domain-containing protein n=1 Tax=Selaginella moellendorffii TaxID=88036 RepID=D8RTM5_SELML|nr:hypothetical protein SELMODRAFT_414700 [Selaginella moellendorffii]
MDSNGPVLKRIISQGHYKIHGVSRGSRRGGTTAQQQQGQGITRQYCIPFSSRRSPNRPSRILATSSCKGVAGGIDREAAAKDFSGMDGEQGRGKAWSRGFAFIMYKSVDDPRKAIDDPNKTTVGMHVIVKFWSDSSKQASKQWTGVYGCQTCRGSEQDGQTGASKMDRRERAGWTDEIRWQSSQLHYILGSVKLEKKKSGNPLLHAYDVDKSLEDFQCLEMITREFGSFQKITRALKFSFCCWMI